MEDRREFRKMGMAEIGIIKSVFRDVFTGEPWKDDWSDDRQLHQYLTDLAGQSNSLTFGLFDAGSLIAVSMGHIKHWYTGTEYYIEEFFVRTEKQKSGIGTCFIKRVEEEIKKMGLTRIFLQTENDMPAYDFYRKNGYHELNSHVSFVKKI